MEIGDISDYFTTICTTNQEPKFVNSESTGMVERYLRLYSSRDNRSLYFCDYNSDFEVVSM